MDELEFPEWAWPSLKAYLIDLALGTVTITVMVVIVAVTYWLLDTYWL